MRRKQHLICGFVFLSFFLLSTQCAQARINSHVNARSAIVIDMENGHVLFEQNPDLVIPPASITKILTLFLVFEAIKEGQVHLRDKVEISSRAASTGGSRMGLKAGTRVPLEELIKGMAVVSGNDACVAAAEHISGKVDRFVRRMNAKARELGMTNSKFMTPNGLPAPGQVTTARDIAKLSIAYLRRFPESLTIHSMQSYTYGKSSRHNANRLLGRCPGVDGLKTGFVCASGYNISATAKRGGTRILAVVLGSRTPWIRLAETEKLIEAGFRECGAPGTNVKYVSTPRPAVATTSPAKPVGRASAGKQARIKAGPAVKTSIRKPVKAAAVRGPVKTAKAKKINEKLSTAKKEKSTAKSVAKQSGKRAVPAKSAGVNASSCKIVHKKPNLKSQPKSIVKTPAKDKGKVAGKKAPVKAAPHANASKKKANG